MSDRNFRFDDLCRLLDQFGFQSRVAGSHRIYHRSDVEEIINLQPQGSLAKPYQVKQVRNLVIKYKIGELDD